MKNIITSVGRTVFKNKQIFAVRAPGLEPGQPKNIGVERQHPQNTGLDTGVLGGKQAQGSRGVPPQQSTQAPKSWEQEKANIGFNADKHEMSWVAQARKGSQSEKDFTGAQKFHGSSMAQEKTNSDASNLAQNLKKDKKSGAKSKTSQAAEFVKKRDQNQGLKKDDVLGRGSYSSYSSTYFKDDGKPAKFHESAEARETTHFADGRVETKSTGPYYRTDESQGWFDGLKESATNAVDWMKEKISGEHPQKQELDQGFKAGEEAKDRVASKLSKESTTGEQTVTSQDQHKSKSSHTFTADKDVVGDKLASGNKTSGTSVKDQAQPKVNKDVKSDIENLIKKGTKN